MPHLNRVKLNKKTPPKGSALLGNWAVLLDPLCRNSRDVVADAAIGRRSAEPDPFVGVHTHDRFGVVAVHGCFDWTDPARKIAFDVVYDFLSVTADVLKHRFEAEHVVSVGEADPYLAVLSDFLVVHDDRLTLEPNPVDIEVDQFADLVRFTGFSICGEGEGEGEKGSEDTQHSVSPWLNVQGLYKR